MSLPFPFWKEATHLPAVIMAQKPAGPPADGSAYFPISEYSAKLAVIHLASTSPLLAIALAMFIARLWIRIVPTWRISAEDYVMSIGVVSPDLREPLPGASTPRSFAYERHTVDAWNASCSRCPDQNLT